MRIKVDGDGYLGRLEDDCLEYDVSLGALQDMCVCMRER